MITEEELRRLSQAVADNLERTVSTSDTDKFAEAVTAFANDLPGCRQPGYLLIGVKDNGSLNGVRQNSRTAQSEHRS